VDDVTEAYVRAASLPAGEPGAVYNVGTGVQTSLAEVVDVARRLLSIETVPRWGSMVSRSWDTTTWIADTRRIRDELGWIPRYDFERGFARLVDWFHAHQDLWPAYAPSVADVV
jgi:nucleoside-diphosphate-sugar epimerase